MEDKDDSRADRSIAMSAQQIGIAVAIVGGVVLCGWAFEIETLKSVLPNFPTMKVNSALGFVLAGSALGLMAQSVESASSVARLALIRALTTLFASLAILTLLQYAFGQDFGIDQMLFPESTYVAGGRASGRMALMTAVNFVLVATAMFCIDWDLPSGKRPSNWLAMVVATNSFVAVLGYLFGIEVFYKVSAYSAVALHTALLFTALAIGLVCARPQASLVRRIVSDDAAGLINRRMLPAAVLIPVALAWLRWQGELAGYYSTVFGLALHATSNIIVFSALVWSLSKAVRRLGDQQQHLLRTNVWQQAILNSANFTIVSTDKVGTIRTINRGAARKLGYLPEQLIGKKITEAIHDPNELTARSAALSEELGYPVAANFDSLVAKARILGSDESDWTYISQNGNRVFVRLSVSPLTDSYGKVSGFVAIGLDITEQRRAERALRESMSALDERNRELQDFAYVASHDLQEPLRKIRMFSDRLLESYAPLLEERAQEYLKRNMQAADRMQTLIDDLTAYSRVATRGAHMIPVDLNRLVATVVDDLEARIESSHGKVEWRELPTIVGDATQLRQVFQNLISNALKFRRADRSPWVRLSATRIAHELNESSWSVCVEDNGIGFDMAHAERVFAPFQRLHTRAEYEGTGIGLAIVRRIVERHGGTISAQATPGAGAVFTLLFPDRDVAPLNDDTSVGAKHDTKA